MNLVWYYLRIGFQDAWRAGGVLLANVAIVAGICLPIFLLLGLKRGLVTQFRSDIQKSPTARQIEAHLGSAGAHLRFTTSYEKEIEKEVPGVALVVPQITLNGWAAHEGKETESTFACTKPGDPFLSFYGADVLKEGDRGVVVSRAVADELGIAYEELSNGRFQVDEDAVITLKVMRGGDDEKHELQTPVRAVFATSDKTLKGLYLDRQMMDWLEDFKKGRSVEALGLKGFADAVKAEYDGYVSFSKYQFSPTDFTRLKARGLTAVPLAESKRKDKQQLRSLYGLLKPHDLHVYWIGASLSTSDGDATVTIDAADVEGITEPDDRVLPWATPRTMNINGAPHQLVGITLNARWLKNYFRNTSTRMKAEVRDFGGTVLRNEMAVMLPMEAIGIRPAAAQPPPPAKTEEPATPATSIPPEATPPQPEGLPGDPPPAAPDATELAGDEPPEPPLPVDPLAPGDEPPEPPELWPRGGKTASLLLGVVRMLGDAGDGFETAIESFARHIPVDPPAAPLPAEPPETVTLKVADKQFAALKLETLSSSSMPLRNKPLWQPLVAGVGGDILSFVGKLEAASRPLPQAAAPGKPAGPALPPGKPAAAPPAEAPPAEAPPAETPPTEAPPVETPPAEAPPAETPPAAAPAGDSKPAGPVAPPEAAPPAETKPAEAKPAAPAAEAKPPAAQPAPVEVEQPQEPWTIENSLIYQVAGSVDDMQFYPGKPPVAVIPARLAAHLARAEEGHLRYDALLNRFAAATSENHFTVARVYADDLNDVPAVDDYFREKGYGTISSRTRVEEMQGYVDTLDVLIFVVLCGVLGFGAVTVMFVFWDVTVRKRGAIGIMRIMGMPPLGVLLITLVRASVVGLIGAVTTLGLGLLLMFLLNTFTTASCIPGLLDGVWILAGSFFCCFLGVAFPAYYAAVWLDPVDAIFASKLQ